MSKDLVARIDDLSKKIDEVTTARSVMGGSTNSGTSDEKKLLMTFGARSLPELLQTNVCDSRFKFVPEEKKLAVMQLKETFDTARFMAQIFRHEQKDPEVEDISRLPAVRGITETAFAKNVGIKSLVRAFGSTVVGEGDEWVPTILSSQYVEEYELERKIASAFKEMPMSGSPWEMPVQTDVTRARLVAEGAAATDATFGTEKIVFNARKLNEYFILPEELNEDSAPAILQLARRDVTVAQLRAVDDSILNGDTTPVHMDSDVTAATDNRKAWIGLRKAALAASSTVDFVGAAATEPKFSDMRKLMSKYGVNPRELAWIVGPSVYAQMLKFENVTTLEKFGPQATVLTGALAVYQGIPIIVSEFLREDLNDAGVHDGVTVSKTVAHLANLTRWYIGRRRPIRVRVAQDSRLEFDRWQLASYQRIDFKGHKQAGVAYASGTISSERSSVLGIDILA